MEIFNANYWEDYNTYNFNKKKKAAQKETTFKKAKVLLKKLKDKESIIKERAKHYVEAMRKCPSELEKRMIEFLDNHNIQYNFQRVFFIKGKKGFVSRFYIADFYIPSKSLIIETDGAFHEKQIKEDQLRTKDIQAHYPNVKVIRWRWHDFESYIKMKELVAKVR